jgi:hypothetical protein
MSVWSGGRVSEYCGDALAPGIVATLDEIAISRDGCDRGIAIKLLYPGRCCCLMMPDFPFGHSLPSLGISSLTDDTRDSSRLRHGAYTQVLRLHLTL